jgi:hypothetical protein
MTFPFAAGAISGNDEMPAFNGATAMLKFRPTHRGSRTAPAEFPRFVAVDMKDICAPTRFAIVEPGVPGYQPVIARDLETADRAALYRGAGRLPTEAERAAALIGGLLGWDDAGADPANYTQMQLPKGH